MRILRRASAPIILSILSLSACGDPASGRGSAASGTGTARATATATATASAAPDEPEPLTAEALIEANDLAKKGDALTAASAALYQALGKPVHTTPGRMVWGVTTNDSCTVLRVEHEGTEISAVYPAATHGRSSVSEFEDCWLYLDKAPPDRDPNAAGPTKDKVYAVKEVLDGMDAGRSKWIGQTIKVRFRVRGVVKSGPKRDEPTLASMTVEDEKDPTKTIAVQIEHDVKAAPNDGQKVVLTAEGVVAKMGRSIGDARIVK